MTAPDGLRPVRGWLCLAVLLAAPVLLRAAAPPPRAAEPVDDDLIEFLGTVDSDDAGWKHYLARTGTPMPVVKKPPALPAGSSAPAKDGAQG